MPDCKAKLSSVENCILLNEKFKLTLIQLTFNVQINIKVCKHILLKDYVLLITGNLLFHHL